MRTCWVIPPKQNAEFVACMEEVLDLYERVYDADCPVVCMDEHGVVRWPFRTDKARITLLHLYPESEVS